MTNLTSAEQAQIQSKRFMDFSWVPLEQRQQFNKLAQDYIAVLAERDALLGEPEAVHAGAQAAIEALRQCQKVKAERDRLEAELVSKNNAYQHAKNDAENHWQEVLRLRAELANCQRDLAAKDQHEAL